MKVIFEQSSTKLINGKNYEHFTKGKTYIAKRIFEQWPWMIMAWDNGEIGRYIHQKDYGEYLLEDD